MQMKTVGYRVARAKGVGLKEKECTTGRKSQRLLDKVVFTRVVCRADATESTHTRH